MIEFTAEEKITGLDISALCNGVDELMELAKEDYKAWSDLGSRYDGDTDSRRRIKEDMIARYNSEISYYAGSKYMKVVTGSSVWGFVVKVHNDKKFRFGDILKAAGWATPARNFARGNVLDGDFRGVRWTGAM
jgi:hypothetical protein